MPVPIDGFSALNLGEIVRGNLELCNYTKPTPVQKWALPIVDQGRDLMACAQTGSGKTAAFLVPILDKINKTGPAVDPPSAGGNSRRPKQYPLALILAPTRELASQIHEESRKVLKKNVVRLEGFIFTFSCDVFLLIYLLNFLLLCDVLGVSLF